MKALVIGVVIIAVSVFMVLPQESYGLGWGADVLSFLRGAAPVIAAFIGLIAVFIGVADMKDRAEAKREEAEKKDIL